MNDLIDLHHSGAIAFCDSNLQKFGVDTECINLFETI